MTGLTVAPEDGETEVLGVDTKDLQSGVVVKDGLIEGTLKYVTDYTGFSGNPTEQEGNYLVLKIDTDDSDDVITVELINGTVGHPVTLDSDRNIVIRITDPVHQKVKVVATNGHNTETRTYGLYRLNLEAAE